MDKVNSALSVATLLVEPPTSWPATVWFTWSTRFSCQWLR